MTWQRIDDDTYIDDTLVTCAEYQLFIDEMREQGKYYQPDHWTSYQFSKGQARGPILGVRSSDARVFCEWLSQRNSNKDWNYRLPNLDEIFKVQKSLYSQFPLGYWINNAQNVLQIAWISNSFTSSIDLSYLINNTLLKDLESVIKRDLNRAFERSIKDGVNLSSVSEVEDASKPVLSVINDLNKACAFAKGRSEASEIVVVLENARHHAEEFFQVINLRNMNNTLVSVIALARSINLALDIIYKRDLKRTSGLSFSDVFNLSRVLDHVLDILVILLVVIDRFIGRSPAFEGIRLVKERIK